MTVVVDKGIWCFGVLVFWCFGVLVVWCFGGLVVVAIKSISRDQANKGQTKKLTYKNTKAQKYHLVAM